MRNKINYVGLVICRQMKQFEMDASKNPQH